MRNEGGGFAEIDDEVAAVLAFVISHTMFLAAQDAKWDDARKFAMAGFPRIASLPLEGKVPRRGG